MEYKDRKYIPWDCVAKSSGTKRIPDSLNQLMKFDSFRHFIPYQGCNSRSIENLEGLSGVWGRDIAYQLLDAYGVADFPKSLKQLKEEQQIIDKLMEVGHISPNEPHTTQMPETYFEFFVRTGQVHGAVAMMKRDDFENPKNPNYAYEQLLCHLGDSEEFPQKNGYFDPNTIRKPMQIVWKNLNNQLIYDLFKRKSISTNNCILNASTALITKKEPDFFEKMRDTHIQELEQALKQANTGSEICRIIAGGAIQTLKQKRKINLTRVMEREL